MKTNSTTKNQRTSCRSTVKTVTWRVGIWLIVLAGLSSPVFAADDDVPFFAGANGAPNIMFIFDNSNTMQDIPYIRADGRPVRPGTNPNSLNNSSAQDWIWRRGVKLNADNTVNEVTGVVQYDDNAFPSDTEMLIPEQTPVNLPGTAPASLEGTADVNDPNIPVVIPAQGMVALPHVVALPDLTGTMTSILNTGRIYDTTRNMPADGNLMSPAGDVNFNKYYLFRYVKVVSFTGVEQIRTITGRLPASNYFTIDTTAAAGGPLVYNAGQTPYTYTILTSQPSPTGIYANTGRVYDTSLDWTTAGTVLTDATLFNTNYLNRLIEVKDKLGTTYQRTITGRTVSTSGGYFSFDTSATAGGPIVYAAAGMPYTYTILTDSPGRVTYATTSTTRVYDANVDWNSITPSYKGKLLTVTSGTNSTATPPTRTILDYSASGKYWTVSAYAGSSAGFPVPCDLTTRYEIKDASTDPSRIYDADLDWITPATALTDATDTLFNLNYRYRMVKLVSATGTVQERTILSRSVSGKYFTIDTAAAAGGPLTYDPAERPYTYTILTDGPGRVTRVRTDNLTYVTDADFNWSTIASWSDFSPKWENRALIITTGANKDLKRKITGYSVSEKRWTVDTPFPVACDLNTRFKIIGTPDDNRLAFGGNHPASKLYQAKKAVNLFLTDPSLKTCVSTDVNGDCLSYQYALNMGFATYLSARVPRITAKYYRLQPEVTTTPALIPDRYYGTYKRTRDTSSSFYHPTLNTTFTSSGWKTAPSGSTAWVTGQVHTGVTVNYTFDRLYNEGSCDQQIIRYTVTNIDPSPGADGLLPDQKKFTVQSRIAKPTEGGYWETSRRYYSPPAVTSCATLPASDGTWTLIASGSSCYLACTFVAAYTPAPTTTPAYYQTQYRDTYGYYNVTDTTLPRYVDRTTNLVNPWFGYIGNGWTTKSAPFASGDYQLLTAPLVGVPINSSGTLGNINPDSFDTSYYMYPGYGTTDRPHGWSYKKTSAAWIYGQSDSWSGADFPKVWSAGASLGTYPWPGNAGGWGWSTWRDTDQQIPYFPAVLGDEMANFTGDDQVVFANLPVYDGTNPSFGDDIGGLNIAKILDYTNLTRMPSPDDSSAWAQSFDYTIMPYSRSIAPNAYSAVQYSGTPIAASLQDLKKYYTTYIQQDSMTQGGCRKNYVILLTDGLESSGGDPVQAAKDLMELTIGGKAYPIKTYVVGFGLDAASQVNLNAIAVAGGTGSAYFANNVETLVDILVNEITSQIIGKSYSRSAPVITAPISGQDLHLYSAYFNYPSWQGHLRAYDVDPGTGLITGPATGWLGDCDTVLGADADAGCEMKIHGRGTVYTSILNAGSYQRLSFDPTNSTSVTSLKTLINPFGVDIDGVGGPNQDLDAATVMHYTLDSGYDGSKYRGGRDKDWPLGDIYHSVPVVVGAPSFNPPPPPVSGTDPYAGYADFKAGLATRETLIYVGANDAMVHAFRADNGQEDWAYIPNSVLGKINEFKEGHRFTVDLPLKAADIYSPGGAGTIWPAVGIGAEGAGWHTLLTSGLRDGGYSYFGLDVTDATNPKPAWETTDVDANITTRDMGKTWSAPAFGRVLINGVQTSVIFVGGGLSAVANTGNTLYIIAAGSGQILKEISIGDVNNHVPSEILLSAETNKTNPYYGNTVAAYFGDTSGDLWKLIDLNDDTGGAVWDPQANLLYDGVGKVFQKAAISKSKGGCTVTVDGIVYTINPNTTFILYGTGDEEDPTNLGSTDRIYEIAEPALTPLVITAPVTPPLRKVWERQFITGEKMLAPPYVHLGTVYFTTYSPEGGCAQGESFLWGLTVSKCGEPGNGPGLIYDIGGTATGGPWDRIPLGPGIASGLTPVGTGAYIQLSGGSGGGTPPTFIRNPTTNKLEFWREEP